MLLWSGIVGRFELFWLVVVSIVNILIMEDYLILEICRVNLQEALDSNCKDVMVKSLNFVSKVLPYSVVYRAVDETRVIVYNNGRTPVRVSYDQLDRLSAVWNVQGFINAIDKEFACVQYNSYRSSFAKDVIFDRDEVFAKDDVLFKSGAGVLSVAGLLQVCSYAVEVGSAVGVDDESFDEVSAAVCVFKGLELVLNNEGFGNKCAKMLHLANDFLVCFVKPSLRSKEDVQIASGLSLFVDLAIDFFAVK